MQDPDQNPPPPNDVQCIDTENVISWIPELGTLFTISHQQQGLNYMSQEEIKQARTDFGAIQLTTQPAPAADIDVQYDTMGTSVGESQCIGENIKYTTQLTCHMYKLHRTLEQDGNTRTEPIYCVWATPANSLAVGAVGSST